MDLGALLKGRHILITGASSGLGEHFARVSARCGAGLTLAARRRDELQELARELTEEGAAFARVMVLDVTDEDSVAAAFTTLTERPIDILVNNAGTAGSGPAIDTPVEEFDRIMATNLRGLWMMSTQAARMWRDAEKPGVIVNIASILGLRITGGTAPYVASKAAVIRLTEALAFEWARFGIRVNALAPGYIATEMNADFFQSEAGREVIRRIPMRRLGNKQDLDGAFLLLASEASAWMTGTTLTIDGGHLVTGI